MKLSEAFATTATASIVAAQTQRRAGRAVPGAGPNRRSRYRPSSTWRGVRDKGSSFAAQLASSQSDREERQSWMTAGSTTISVPYSIEDLMIAGLELSREKDGRRRRAHLLLSGHPPTAKRRLGLGRIALALPGERGTRLELATLTLARWLSHSVFEPGQVRRQEAYLPPISTTVPPRPLGKPR